MIFSYQPTEADHADPICQHTPPSPLPLDFLPHPPNLAILSNLTTSPIEMPQPSFCSHIEMQVLWQIEINDSDVKIQKKSARLDIFGMVTFQAHLA